MNLRWVHVWKHVSDVALYFWTQPRCLGFGVPWQVFFMVVAMIKFDTQDESEVADWPAHVQSDPRSDQSFCCPLTESMDIVE